MGVVGKEVFLLVRSQQIQQEQVGLFDAGAAHLRPGLLEPVYAVPDEVVTPRPAQVQVGRVERDHLVGQLSEESTGRLAVGSRQRVELLGIHAHASHAYVFRRRLADDPVEGSRETMSVLRNGQGRWRCCLCVHSVVQERMILHLITSKEVFLVVLFRGRHGS